MKDLGYKNKVLTGVYTTVISSDEDTFRRLIVTRKLEEKKATLDFFVSGFKYADASDFLLVLRAGEQLEIVREYHNPFDKNAVAIYTYDFVKLGYVPKDIALLFSSRLDEGEKIKIKIKKINNSKRNDDSTRIEVRSLINI